MDKETGKRLAGGKPSRKEKEKKPKKPSRFSKQQKVMIAIIIVLLILVGVVLGFKSMFVKPQLPGGLDDRPQKEEIDWGKGIAPRASGERKSKDWYTVLILGRDTGGGGNTDTILLASYDVTNQKATVMSIPRDTMVNVSWDIKRINSVYNMHGGGNKGINALYKEISQLVGFEPDFQVVVEWEAVGEIVDAMGGVWFDVPMEMNYTDPYQDLAIWQQKGLRLLDGEDAMQVLRFRHNSNGTGYPDGDLGRIKTQQGFLKAMVEQLLKLENIGKVNKFIDVFEKNVETDLSFQNILWFARSAYLGGLSMENVKFVTMPNTPSYCWSRTYQNNQSYVTPKATELLDLVNNELSPFAEQFTLRDLDIMSVNKDGSISSSTGHVEDSRAAVPPVKKPPKQDVPPEEPLVDENGNLIPDGSGSIIVNPDGSITVPPDGGGQPLDPVIPPEVIDPVTPPVDGGTESPEQIPPEGETTDPVTPPAPEPPPVEPVTPPPVEELPTEPGFSVIEPEPAA